MSEAETQLWTDVDFHRRLELGVRGAAVENRPYSVVVCTPQHIIGNGVEALIDIAASCLRDLLRDEDLPGLVDDESLVIGLPDTKLDGARVLAHRLKSELGRRTAYLGITVWLAGYASLPQDGKTADELLQAAIGSSKSSRSRAA